MPRSIRREKKVVWGCLSQNLMPCSLTLLGIHFRNLHKIFSTFLQKLFDIVASHEVVVNILRALATQSMMLCPIDVHTPLSRMLPLASLNPIGIRQANCANLFKLQLHTNTHAVARQSDSQTARQPDSQLGQLSTAFIAHN